MNPIPFVLQAMPLFAVAGTFMLIMAYDKAHLIERAKNRGIETTGTVVEIYREPGGLFNSGGGEREAPVVEFATKWGTHRHYVPDFQLPGRYRVGQEVRVWYYFYKSKREVAIEGEGPASIVKPLYRWGIFFCLLGYPFVIRKLWLFWG